MRGCRTLRLLAALIIRAFDSSFCLLVAAAADYVASPDRFCCCHDAVAHRGTKLVAQNCSAPGHPAWNATNWVDEEGSVADGFSSRCLARTINRGYLSGCYTGGCGRNSGLSQPFLVCVPSLSWQWQSIATHRRPQRKAPFSCRAFPVAFDQQLLRRRAVAAVWLGCGQSAMGRRL
jgi:hypothetical protein